MIFDNPAAAHRRVFVTIGWVSQKQRELAAERQRRVALAYLDNVRNALGVSDFRPFFSNLLRNAQDLRDPASNNFNLFQFGAARHIGCGEHRDLATLDGPLEVRGAVLKHIPGAGNASLADVEQLGSSANWQTFHQISALAVAQCRELRRGYRALALIKVPAPQIR
jgi:hypothetical protein